MSFAYQTLLDSLPIDIWNIIVDFIFQFDDTSLLWKRSTIRDLSRLSLVNKELSMKLRPLMFKIVTLQCPRDITFLRCLLHSDTSSWLAGHIEQILVLDMATISISGVLRILPSLRSLDILENRGYKPIIESNLRSKLSCAHSLRILRIYAVRFPSFTNLVRLVGALPTLEKLTLSEVEWPRVHDPRILQSWRANIRELSAILCCIMIVGGQHWPIAWLIMARCIRLLG